MFFEFRTIFVKLIVPIRHEGRMSFWYEAFSLMVRSYEKQFGYLGVSYSLLGYRFIENKSMLGINLGVG